MSVDVIIPAAGAGKRMKGDIPKQYMSLDGRPLILHTLLKFQDSRLVDRIVLVVAKKEMDWVREHIIKDIDKPLEVVEGGEKRQDSVAAGLNSIWDSTADGDIVLVHDGARPLVDISCIEDCIIQAETSGACLLGMRIKETIKRVEEKDIIRETVPSKGLWVAQTPQAFRASVLKEAHLLAKEEGFYGTDEASLVERLPFPVRIIPGSPWNIKVTYPEDLRFAEEILRTRRGQ